MLRQTPDFDASELELQSRLSERTGVCPPLDVLLALQQDALPAELAEPARAHLAVCPLCTMLLADMATLPEAQFSPAQQERIAASLPGKNARSSLWGVGGKWMTAVAATLLLAGGLFLWTHRERNATVALVEPASVPAILQPKEIPFAPLASPSSSAALLTRGSSSHDGPAHEELLPAFRAYNRADYSAAARQFETLAAEYPQSQMILLYLGVSQLALHQDQAADATLQRAHATRMQYDADAVQWYSAVVASREHTAQARPLLEELCKKKQSVYSAQSCQALRSTDAKQ